MIRRKLDETTYTGLMTLLVSFVNSLNKKCFRTKKDNKLEMTSTKHEYAAKGKYKIMVKVVDILGIDTSQVVEVKIS